jgi:hypothetical protein
MSAFDTGSTLKIHELLSRYCHLVDHDQGAAWAALFTPDGRFEVISAIRLEGTEQLVTLPGSVQQHGGGKWRHQLTNIVIDAGAGPDEAIVTAYGLVTDWREGGSLSSFSDYRIVLRKSDGWRIAALVATMA